MYVADAYVSALFIVSAAVLLKWYDEAELFESILMLTYVVPELATDPAE